MASNRIGSIIFRSCIMPKSTMTGFIRTMYTQTRPHLNVNKNTKFIVQGITGKQGIQTTVCRRGIETASSQSAETEEPNAKNAGQQTDKQLEELLKQIESYKEKLAATEDKYKRQLAETENVRQRFMRQVEEAKSFGIQNFCKDMLEIADVLELATESVPKDSLTKDENAALKQLHDGLIMTQTQMSKIFKKHGLVPVRPLGEKFNPNIHEAVFQVPDATKEAGSIANVVKIGYLLHDRLIRPAKVGVYISP